MTGEPLHARLWRAEQPVAERCLTHPFVQGLGDGTLDPEAFRRYVAQDAFFLRAFFSAYALAAARSVATQGMAPRLHALMGGVLDELKLHGAYAESLSIDLDEVVPVAATRAYTDFLLRTAWSGNLGEILAAMTPCMRLYAYLGQGLEAGARPNNPYREWIDTYASPEFEALAAELETLLDRCASPSDRLADAYAYAMRCELDFFSAFVAEGG